MNYEKVFEEKKYLKRKKYKLREGPWKIYLKNMNLEKVAVEGRCAVFLWDLGCEI